jgi:hypothetical protein
VRVRDRYQAVWLVRVFLVIGLAVSLLVPTQSRAQLGPEQEVAPPPPSIGADVPLVYFGPTPSQVDPRLVGPVHLLKAGQVDLQNATVTLPLYKGKLRDGRLVWYILTDTDDEANAAALGLNFSSKLTYAGPGARLATLENDATLTFDRGAVDFSPKHSVVPGDAPNYFPPKSFQPGSVGDRDYSPLVRIVNAGNHIYNAPTVAFNVSSDQLNRFCTGNVDHDIVHDKVVKICPRDTTVTLALTVGFSFAHPILYLSTDANDALPAAMEGATYAPRLKNIATGHDDSAFSAVERIFGFVNGPTGQDNPQRQGFNSALSDGRGPLNVFGGIPTVATDYSPLWDLNAGEWTKEAIDKGYRSRLIEEFQILGFVERHWVTGPGGGKFGSTGFIINCPIVERLN